MSKSIPIDSDRYFIIDLHGIVIFISILFSSTARIRNSQSRQISETIAIGDVNPLSYPGPTFIKFSVSDRSSN